MNQEQDIYAYIIQEENDYETQDKMIGENWYWNMRKHVQLIFHLMHGVFFTGENNWMRHFKAVMRPLMQFSLWVEDIEVKDIVFFIENYTGRAASFLLKKYHEEVYSREHDLDAMIDEIAESDIPYGGALVEEGVERPKVIPLQSIAFCDQTDMEGGPIGFKHIFSPSKLRAMAKYGWGEEKNGADISIEDLILVATNKKDADGSLSENQNQTTGKNIEVYIIKGDMPEDWLLDNENFDDVYGQVQIRALYTNKNEGKEGACLYRKKEHESSIKVHVSEPIFGRALGWSDGEALLYPQIFTNLASIYKTGLLEAAGKVPIWTDDDTFTAQMIQDMENLEIMKLGEGKQIGVVPTAFPANFNLFESSINELYESGQLAVSAFDSSLGKEESAGTTFRGQERLVAQGRGWHDRRRGKRAKFIEEIYRDWIIPDMVKEINKGKKFLATLSTEELMWVADQLATNAVNKRIKEMVLNGKLVNKEEQELMTQTFKQDFLKKGNKHLLETLKDEFEDIGKRIGINIVGKQKNLVALSDKLFSIIETAMANPQGFQMAMQNPAIARAFENVLEYSNIPIPDFYALTQSQPAVPSPLQQEKPALASTVTPTATPNG